MKCPANNTNATAQMIYHKCSFKLPLFARTMPVPAGESWCSMCMNRLLTSPVTEWWQFRFCWQLLLWHPQSRMNDPKIWWNPHPPVAKLTQTSAQSSAWTRVAFVAVGTVGHCVCHELTDMPTSLPLGINHYRSSQHTDQTQTVSELFRCTFKIVGCWWSLTARSSGIKCQHGSNWPWDVIISPDCRNAKNLRQHIAHNRMLS